MKDIDLDEIFDSARKFLFLKERNTSFLDEKRKINSLLDSLSQFENRKIVELNYKDGNFTLISTKLGE